MSTTAADVPTDVSVRDLLEAGLHFGHQTKRWDPRMKPYIFAERNGIYIIDLNKSLEALNEARQFLYDTVVRGRKVLFVGTKKQAQDTVRETAAKLEMPYIVHRWLGGMLTNSVTVRKSVARMRELETMAEKGELDVLSKKEGAKLRRELAKLHRNLLGVADMDNPPGAIFIVDVNRESIAIKEANRLNIPVVALVDTNSNPEDIEYPIPGNDDAIRAIQLVVTSLANTIQEASNEYAKIAAEEARRKAAEEAERKARQEKERKQREEAEAKKREETAAAARKALEKKKAEEAAKTEEARKAKPAAEPVTEKPAEKAPAAAAAEAPAEAPAEEAPAEKKVEAGEG